MLAFQPASAFRGVFFFFFFLCHGSENIETALGWCSQKKGGARPGSRVTGGD